MQLHKLHLGILFIKEKLCFKPISVQRPCVYAKYKEFSMNKLKSMKVIR